MSILPRRLPTFGFALALFAFLLPFLSISCAGAHVTMTGLQLATGSVSSEMASMGMTQKGWNSKDEGYSGDVFTLVALVLTLGGLVLAIAKGAGAHKIGISLAGLAAISLAASRANFLRSVLAEGRGMATVQFELGFWLAFYTLGLTIAAYIVAQWDLPMWRKERETLYWFSVKRTASGKSNANIVREPQAAFARRADRRKQRPWRA